MARGWDAVGRLLASGGVPSVFPGRIRHPESDVPVSLHQTRVDEVKCPCIRAAAKVPPAGLDLERGARSLVLSLEMLFIAGFRVKSTG